MITVKLSGGLGNQMFQYAYGYQMAKKANTGIVIDTSWFDLQNLRTPEILKFNIIYDSVEQIWDTNPAIKFFNKQIVNRSLRIIGLEKCTIGGYKYFKETRYRYKDSIALYEEDGSYLDGYWQCPRYFEHIKNDLIKLYQTNEISPEVIELGEELKKQSSIAIHVRRGDYPNRKQLLSRLIALSNSYYEKSVACMLEKVEANSRFYVFSNNMEDAIDILRPLLRDKITKIGIKTNALDEWYLMKCCRNIIIGNSTFSWWSAYLNESDEKIVIAPDRYMGNDNIWPDKWILVDAE